MADPPNRQGFASNSPHSSACQQLSCSPPPFPAPPKMRPKPTCPIPNPCQHGRAFCSSPPQIFCPRPKPHVSPLVGLLASTQIWLVVIYNGRVKHQLEESFPTEPLMIVPCGRNALSQLWDSALGGLERCLTCKCWSCLSAAGASWERCGQRHSCLNSKPTTCHFFFSPLLHLEMRCELCICLNCYQRCSNHT